MPDQWNAETYREQERRWRVAADKLPEGCERDVCLTLAEGYAHLAKLIDRSGLLHSGAAPDSNSMA
jgi:hypothetical protein